MCEEHRGQVISHVISDTLSSSIYIPPTSIPPARSSTKPPTSIVPAASCEDHPVHTIHFSDQTSTNRSQVDIANDDAMFVACTLGTQPSKRCLLYSDSTSTKKQKIAEAPSRIVLDFSAIEKAAVLPGKKNCEGTR